MTPPRDARSPCAADALFSVKPIAVNGKTVGIAGLSDALAAVRARGLTGDAAIACALLEEVETCNFVPAPLREEYGKALLGEYRAGQQKLP